MTSDEYFWGWMAYLLGTATLYAILWYWLGKIRWREVSQLLRLIFAVVLFMPWYTDADKDFLSPAWMVCIGDAFTKSPEEAWRSGSALLIALATMVLLSALLYYWQSRRAAQRANSSGAGSGDGHGTPE